MENGNLDEEGWFLYLSCNGHQDYDFKRHDWDLMVELLKQYQDHFGHTNVPTVLFFFNFLNKCRPMEL